MDEGRIVAWHKRVGDPVAAGDVLFEVETDKATMEVESPTTGTLRRILFPADATAPVATVIALITETADEPLPSDAAGAGLPKPSLPATAQPSTGPGSRGGSLRAQGPLPLGPSVGLAALTRSLAPFGRSVCSTPLKRKRKE
jgi:pyruvate/2-oxoglutarate dehydrogenase complex dihydrolipoamide acyltransferase (E2) component